MTLMLLTCNAHFFKKFTALFKSETANILKNHCCLGIIIMNHNTNIFANLYDVKILNYIATKMYLMLINWYLKMWKNALNFRNIAPVIVYFANLYLFLELSSEDSKIGPGSKVQWIWLFLTAFWSACLLAIIIPFQISHLVH